jgi:hypothetical protein
MECKYSSFSEVWGLDKGIVGVNEMYVDWE